MQGVLTSRHFIYLVEGDPVPRERLNDSELASRLSYFLWSSMPDDGLLAAARSGSLSVVRRTSSPSQGTTSSPSNAPTDKMSVVLEQEVDRMLADGKTNRFINDFVRQWLQLHRLGMFPPDKKLYPTYDAWLETSLRAEPVEFFREMFAKNMPVDSFIDSDWTMANARLCDFYGLPEPKTGGFQQVALKPEDHRGGLLTMGAVLGLTSDGTRHRPVHRGVWLSEAIFNKTPPPPPANVDPIEPIPPTGTKITIRQRIEAHAKNASCAACHAKIDPLGLAFDQYDAVGQWHSRAGADGCRRESRRRCLGCDARRPLVQRLDAIQEAAHRRPRSNRASLHRAPLHLRPPPSAHRRRSRRPKVDRSRSEEKRVPSERHHSRRGNV